MKTNTIKSEYKDGKLYITFTYWEGKCACDGKTITRPFDKDPTQQELVKSIYL